MRTYVRPRGPQSASIAFCAEQPGKQEVRRGSTLVGPSWEVLEECIISAGGQPGTYYYTNVVKHLDHPISDYISYDRGKIKAAPEFAEYQNALFEELSSLDANVVVAIGNVALYALTGNWGVTKWRGSILWSSPINKKVIPCIHPATVIPPKNQYVNRYLIIGDIQRALKQAEYPDLRLTHRELILRPSYEHCEEFLTACIEQDDLPEDSDGIIDFDIEIYNGEVSCIAIAQSPTLAISIPFMFEHGDYFTPPKETSLWRLIGALLEHPKLEKRGQNVIFDTHFLLRKYGIKACNLHDTMIAQKIICGEMPAGLHFITSVYTDIPYYKDDGKYWDPRYGTWDVLWRYNALDAISTAAAHPHQMKLLDSRKNIPTYLNQCKLIPPLVYIMEKGIKCDVAQMKARAEKLSSEVIQLKEHLVKITGKQLNPNSSKQLQEHFYKNLGLKPYVKRGGGITTDETALKRIARKGFPEAQTILDIRKKIKLIGTYLNPDKVDTDGRLRCSYNPVGTRYSRISSSESIFGTGMNMQNWPHELLSILGPDDLMLYYSLDLSQIENRIVAFVGRIPAMMHAFNTGIDVHKLTAAMIFGINMEEVTKDQRQWGKKSNHGLNYDLGYKRFALLHEIPEAKAKYIVTKYHSVYPEVRGVYHHEVRKSLAEHRALTNLLGRTTYFYDKWGDQLFKDAYSCIPQSTCGDLLNIYGVNYVYYNQNIFYPLELLTQVHDSLGGQLPISLPWRQQAEILNLIRTSLEHPLTTKEGITFSVPVDLSMSLTLRGHDGGYGDGLELQGDNFPRDNDKLAEILEANFRHLRTKMNKEWYGELCYYG